MKKAFLILGLVIGLVGCPKEQSCDDDDKDRYLAFAGHQIHYELRGRGPETLVFVHGWTGSTETWKFQSDAFPEHRVIAVDLPGHGRSSRIEGVPYTTEMYADSVRRVLAAERVTAAFCFGHSMGFAVVEVIAAKYPELCVGLGAIDGLHFDVPADAAGQAAWRQQTLAMVASMTDERARESFIDMLLLPDTPERLRHDVLKTSRTVPMSIGRAAMEGAVADVRYWTPKRVDVPCLAVYSPAYGLPPSYRHDLARTFPALEYHAVANVSHFFMLEIPYRLNQWIADLVAHHSRSS